MAIIGTELSVLPVLTSTMPAATPFVDIINALVLAGVSGLMFLGLISWMDHVATNSRIPKAHKTLALIVAHVTFSFEAVMYPLTNETVAMLGVEGAALADAGVLAVIVGAVSYWLISLDRRTMNYGESRKIRSAKSDRTLLVGVVFAACCAASVPFLASVNQQISWQKTGNTAEIIDLAGRQWLLSQRVNRFALSPDQADRRNLEQAIARAREQAIILDLLVTRYADSNNLNARDRAFLPGNPVLVDLRNKYLGLASSVLTTEDEPTRSDLVADLQRATYAFQPAMESAVDAFQATEDNLREVQKTGQLYRMMLGPVVFLGLALGLFWPLLRLVNAQRYGLDLRRRDAESATIAKGQFLATMSHELRTPMNGVLGMLQLLSNSDLNEKQRNQATTATESAKDLLKILNEILDFSKLERGQLELEDVPFSPARITKDVLSLLSMQARAKSVELRCSVHGRVPDWITGDAMRIRQILINLVGNAIKFTEEGQVEVNVRYKGTDALGILRVEVKDTGIGISGGAQARIFERFAQADATITRKFGGTGLGLSICRQLVELMGGEIGLKSTEGFGSTFWFTVLTKPAKAPKRPVAQVTKDKKTAAAGSATKSEQTPVELEKPRPLSILAAEDNPVNQQVVTAFVTAAGHNIAIVENGAEAVTAVHQSDFDLVLMDVQMPVMDGLQATKKIRAFAGPKANIPIIAVTANCMEGDREQYLAAGMTGFIPKPLNPDNLEKALTEAMASARAKKILRKAG